MLPNPNKKRKRGYLSPSVKTPTPTPINENILKVSFKDKIYEIDIVPTTNFTQLRESFIRKLVEDGKIEADVREEDIKVRFLYLGKIYSVDKDGDKIVIEIPKFDHRLSFNTLIQITKHSLVKGGITRKYRLKKKKTRRLRRRGL